MKLKSTIITTIYILVCIILLSLFVANYENIVYPLLKHPILLCILVVLNFLIFYTQSSFFFHLCGSDYSIGIYEGVTIWGASSLLSYVSIFQSHLLIRGAYIKSRGIPIRIIFSVTVIQLIVNIWTGLIFITCILAFKNNLTLFSIPAALLFLPLLLNYYFIYLKRNNFKYTPHLLAFEPYLKYILSIKTIVYSTSFYITSSLSIFLAFNLLKHSIEISEAILIASFVSMSSVISILPNNLGIQEIIIGFIGNVPLEIGINASLSLRFAQILAGSILILASFKIVSHYIRQNNVQ